MIESIIVNHLTIPSYKPSNLTHRKQFDLISNETISTLDDDWFEKDVEKVNVLRHLDERKIILATKKAIGDHFEQRLQTAFQQFIACYNLGYKIKEGKVEDQGPSARQLKGISFNAAHGGNLPCLHVETADEELILFKNSDMYLRSNSTDELVKSVNCGDIIIDGRSNFDEKVRSALLKILNKVSYAKISPIDAYHKFFKALKVNVKKAIQLPSIKKNQKIVLKIYEESLLKLEQKLTDSTSFFDTLLNVKNNSNLTNRAREILYKHRFTIIQEHFALQSAVKNRISKVQFQILKEQRQPPHFDYIFKRVFLEKCQKNTYFCKHFDNLTKMFGWSKASFNLKLSRVKKTEEIVYKNAKLIDALVQRLIPLFEQLNQCEASYQRALLIDLRNCLGYSQRTLAAIFKKRFPKSVMSQSTLWRTEKGIRAVDKDLLKKMAPLLNIDETNFFPLLEI